MNSAKTIANSDQGFYTETFPPITNCVVIGSGAMGGSYGYVLLKAQLPTK